jgi:hypothetical protein
MAVCKAIVSRMGRVGFARLRQWFDRLGAELTHDLDDYTMLPAVRNFTVRQCYEHPVRRRHSRTELPPSLHLLLI